MKDGLFKKRNTLFVEITFHIFINCNNILLKLVSECKLSVFCVMLDAANGYGYYTERR